MPVLKYFKERDSDRNYKERIHAEHNIPSTEMNRDVYADCRESHPKIKSQNDFIKAIQDRKKMEEKKISMLTNKIIKEQ